MEAKAPCTVAIFVSGRGTNMEALLRGVRDGRLPVRVAFVAGDRPGAPALEKARRAGIPALFLGKERERFEEEALRQLEAHKVDLICLAGFMKILSPDFVRKFWKRILNIHPALLPSFRGLSAQARALKAGVRIAGATVHWVDEKVDHGPILMQQAVPVFPWDTEDSLSQRILREEHRIYIRAVQQAIREIQERRQVHA